MKKRYKILIIGAVLLIILVVIAQFYANSFLQKLIRQEINTFVAEQEGNYFIEVDKITSQILLKRFVLSGIKVHSNDTLPINRDNSFTIDLERLVVKLDGISDIFKDGTLKLKTIKLDHPQINYTYKVKTDSDTVPVKEEFKSDQLKKIQLRSFEIVNGQFHLNKYKDSTSTSVATVFNVDFEMNDIFLSLEETKIERKLTFEELQADLGNIVYHDAENHDISCSNLYFSNDDKVISFVDFEIKDKASLERVKNDFSIKRPWIESKIKQLDIKLDLQKIKQKELDFQLIEMKDLDVYVFHNKKDSSTFSFEHFLASIPFPFNVDTLKVEKTDLDLSLINKEGKNDDFLINELQMEIQHISNKESYTQMHPRIIGQLESKLWKKGYIKADFNYNQLSQQFTSKLRLKEFPEQKLIRFANTSDIAIIKRGNIKDWDLEIAKDSSHIEGNFKAHVNNLDMEYNDFPEHANLNSINTKIGKLNIISSFYKNKDKPIDILIDSIYMDSPRIVFNAKKGSSEKNPKKNDQKTINKEQKKTEGLINIQSIDIRNASFNYKKQGIKEDVLSIESFSIQDRFLAIDLSKEGIDKLTKTGTYKINASHFEYFDPPSNYLSFKDASINKKDNTLSLTGLRFKDKTSKKQFHESSAEGNDWKSAYIEKVNVDIDLDMLLKKEVHCSKVTFIKPILTHIQAVDRKAKELRKTNADFSLPISIDIIEIVDADVDFRIKKKDEKEFEIFDLSHLNGSFKNLQINSASNSSRFSGSIHARFYDQSEIDVFVSHDFMRKNASSHIKGKARNISLSTLKDKLAFFQKIDLKEGHIAAVEFNIDINNKNAEGILIVDTLSVSEYKLSKDPNGDFLSLTMNEIKSSFTIPAKKNIFVSKIEIINPEVDIHYIPAKNSISTKETKKRSPIFVEKGKFNSLFKIEKVMVENATLKQFTRRNKEFTTLHSKPT